jgi:hypothetical protein
MQAGQQPGLFWLGQEDAASWAAAAEKHLDYSLGPVFGGGFHVELKLPSAEIAKKKVAANLDLLGELAVTWKNSPDTLRLEIALPYHGVFVKRNRNSTVPSLAVWVAWLGERPGFRYLPKEKDDGPVFWRLGLPGGTYGGNRDLEPPRKNLTEKKRKETLKYWHRVLPPHDVCREFLQEFSQQQGPVVLLPTGKTEKRHEFWKKLHDLATESFKPEDITDEDHLDHRILVTFP